MTNAHVHQTIKFYERGGALWIKLDDGASEGRMVVDRLATEEDAARFSPQYAAFVRSKVPPPPPPPTDAERERDAWIETARQHARNENYYRSLVRQIGEMLGPDAYTSDDGSVQQDVLCAKVPELVARLISAYRNAVAAHAKETGYELLPVSDDREVKELLGQKDNGA